MALTILALTTGAFAQEAEPEYDIDVPQQDAASALEQLAEQTGAITLFPYDLAASRTSNAVVGRFTLPDAVELLLDGTGLSGGLSEKRVISIAATAATARTNEETSVEVQREGFFGSLLAALGLTAGAGGAQQAVAQVDTGSRYETEEITVTSRRIEEGLQDAPLAITAMSGVELENRGALDVVDFARTAPNVTMENNGTISGFGAAPRTAIRGIGQSDFVINTDPAIGLYVDDVYLGRSIGSLLELLDIERVEALRGPQGTLFGRNSTGGVINIISAKPSVEEGFTANASAGFGELGYLLVHGLINAPLSETTALRVSAFKRERDGFIPALQYNDLELGAEDVTGFRAALRFEPNDSLMIDLDADLTDRNDSPAPLIIAQMGDLSVGEQDLDLVPGPRQQGQSTSIFGRIFNREPRGPQVAPNNRPYISTDPLCGTNGQAYRDATPACLGNYWAGSLNGSNASWWDTDGNKIRPLQSLESYGFGLRINWGGESVSFKSITSSRGFDSRFINSSPAPIMVSGNHNENFEQDQITQEFQWSGSLVDGNFDWLLGAFYMAEDGNERVAVIAPYGPGSFNNDVNFLPIGNTQDRFIDNTSTAVFGQGIYHFNDNVHLTLGARYTDEKKGGRFELYNDNPVDSITLAALAEIDETNVMANLSWNLTDEIMIYGQFSDGFRNGGFPSRQPPGITELQIYGPEFVDSYELGLKMTAMDGRLRTNVAVFDMEYTNMQISAAQLNPETLATPLTTDNLGDASLYGIEVETNFLATDNLRLDASIGYLSNEVDSLRTGGLIVNNGSNLRKVIDTSNELPFAPEWQVNLGFNYSHFFQNGAELQTRFDYFYEAEQWGTIGNYTNELIPSISRVNLMVSYMPSGGDWELTLGARNLTDEDNISNSQVLQGLQQGLFQVYQRPREAFIMYKQFWDNN
ncbi:MAG: TonB-dependent receptor [Pseudomonadota bacterium]|nr:TonB-dependent receptor [Pseudomonadota bacterium]